MAPYGGNANSVLLVMTPALRTMNPRFLLFIVFLLVLVDTGKSDDNTNESYYMNGSTRCLRCPAGKYVVKHCTIQDTPSTCESCLRGETYSEHLTGLTECLQCKVCRTDEEEEVSPCMVKKNTVCRCKKGTYCPGDEPCEICQKCTTSCPPNQEIQTPCNSTSDIECGPPKTANKMLLAILLPIGSILFVAFCACVCYFCFGKKCNKLKWKEKAPAEDIERPFLPPPRPQLHWKENTEENETNEAIHKTFNYFLELVPTNEFEKFVRELGLTNNEIDWAKQDNSGTYNQHYAMFVKLRQDGKFDVNIWLNKLYDIRMGDVAQRITEKLTREGWFVTSIQK
ncbi:tumor necrosis factor receptor superfamily member 10B-like isoform X2 [Bufo gargarizans]|uniref:tumor necrosis factor receptor superfamily member 10B-like isoform X2 n=1 Tax=Bufo gargarizans TaxID=30331 RepID=UPI001CF48FA8|nr:tumor necrosis factor receptor superfamily member 10B-like isoform X2 [Bufo gargarizans]